jgi:hypothetical protein
MGYGAPLPPDHDRPQPAENSGTKPPAAPLSPLVTGGATLVPEALLKHLGKRKPFTKADWDEVYFAIGKPGGGTFAHPILACAYAGYLSPGLDVEVREVWLRYRAADPTLADEVLERASPEANLWAATRAEARAIRSTYTAMLRDHQVKGRGYMDCTDEAYLRLFDGPAWRLRQERGLKKGTNVRDHMDIVELSAIDSGRASMAHARPHALGNSQADAQRSIHP